MFADSMVDGKNGVWWGLGGGQGGNVKMERGRGGIVLSETAARSRAKGHEVSIRFVVVDGPAFRAEGRGVGEVGR